ncbi:hypothetical protein ERO13_A07G177201v2 [Gossypium hirsutum]|nr:hypothetical protein ERO13_A07G177201v2 [Gossypium hirsutum]
MILLEFIYLVFYGFLHFLVSFTVFKIWVLFVFFCSMMIDICFNHTENRDLGGFEGNVVSIHVLFF